MSKLKTTLTTLRTRLVWLALLALPLILAACNNGSSGGNGY
jgi:predicted small secreted protein